MNDVTPPPSRPRSNAPAVFARQGISFLVVGGIQLGLDWGTFVALSALGVPVPAANIVGRIAGATLGFWLNAHFTFRDAESGIAPRGWSNGMKFLALWSLTTVLSTLLVSTVSGAVGLRWAWVGKPLIDGVLAVLSFALSKYWVFR